MQNFSSRKKGNSRRSFSLGLLGVITIIVVVVLMLILLRGVFATAGSYVAAPLYGLNTWFRESSSGLPAYLRDRASLLGEITTLRETVMSSSGDRDTIERLERENEELRMLLGDSEKETYIAAAVISRPPSMPYDALLIDRGSADGIMAGAVVFYADDRAIGTVARVFEGSAVINLFSTPDAKTTVYIVGPNIYTTAHGAGGGVVRVSVPQGIVLAEDNLVLLPGLPGGVLGRISAIQSEATNPEQNAYIVHDVPLQSLRLVSVATTPPPSISFDAARASIEQHKEALRIEVPAGVLVDTAATSTATTSTETIRATTTSEVVETQ